MVIKEIQFLSHSLLIYGYGLKCLNWGINCFRQRFTTSCPKIRCGTVRNLTHVLYKCSSFLFFKLFCCEVRPTWWNYSVLVVDSTQCTWLLRISRLYWIDQEQFFRLKKKSLVSYVFVVIYKKILLIRWGVKLNYRIYLPYSYIYLFKSNLVFI